LRTISKKTKYALQALFALTRRDGTGPVLIATLAKEESIPLKFLEVILLELRNGGVVESKKGRSGGYKLSRAPSEITVGSVIRILEGPIAPLPCASETAFRKCEECQDIARCETRLVMRQVRDAMAHVLDHITLADVVQQGHFLREQKKAQDALMYYI